MITIFIIVFSSWHRASRSARSLCVAALAAGLLGAGLSHAQEGQPGASQAETKADSESAPAKEPAEEPAEEPDFEETIEVTVQGKSEAEHIRQSAESVQVVETEQSQREAADMGTVLARTEGVGVRRSGGLGSRASFSLGGFTDEQIRFFLDGIPLELAGFGLGIANVPVNLIDRVEIYQGVVPSRFGADALGGAVQLVTDQDPRKKGLSASYEFGSYGTHRLTAGGKYFHEPMRLLVRANGFFDRTVNDYSVDVEAADEQGRVTPARVNRFHDGYRAVGGGIEAGVIDRPWASLLLVRAFMSQYDKDIQHSVTMDVPYGEVSSAEMSAGATLRFEQSYSRGVSVDAVAGYTWRRTSFTDLGTCAYDWFGRCVAQLPQPGETEARAIDRFVGQHVGFARLHLGWDIAGPGIFRLSLAPTFVSRTGEDRSLRALQMPDPLLGDRNMFSWVGGLEFEFDSPDDRLENIAFAKVYVQRARSEKLLPAGSFAGVGLDARRAGIGDSLRYRLSPEIYAKASYEWAARLPRPDEIFGDGILISENLEIQPENSHNLNLGLTLDTPETARGTFRASVLGFGRLADQLIVLIGRESYFTHLNVFAARSLGGTGAVGWTSPGQHFAIDGNVTWQDFRNISDQGQFGAFDGQRIPNRPYLQANGSARFQLGRLMSSRDELSLTWHARYVHSFFRAWEGLGQKDSKQVVPTQFLQSVALTYVTRPSQTTLSWTVDVQNLTDARAFDFFGVQRPGRSIFAKLTVDLLGEDSP
ncbi:TonB-dependent siderophore myxochelin receptor MxcH [Hyalangium sp.]|uniref:TonB-dependent siderophore myxochelin receptor MxcH n=1 Tax=Hyalangium sp. TaxID=2028555 RepID=UPI002D363329|nr:TonB-dependent siderophore myxochelin receptor MxcH [Hyalangium sp.]HYI00037.1 TonB-dependent siderophore myxochelin receptor MxcH [Hyalangium sp.]